MQSETRRETECPEIPAISVEDSPTRQGVTNQPILLDPETIPGVNAETQKCWSSRREGHTAIHCLEPLACIRIVVEFRDGFDVAIKILRSKWQRGLVPANDSVELTVLAVTPRFIVLG